MIKRTIPAIPEKNDTKKGFFTPITLYKYPDTTTPTISVAHVISPFIINSLISTFIVPITIVSLLLGENFLVYLKKIYKKTKEEFK